MVHNPVGQYNLQSLIATGAIVRAHYLTGTIEKTPLLRGFEKFWQRSRGYLRNDEGKSIPEFKAESRFYRFSHG